MRVGWARDAAGARIDQVLAFAMRAPASFTGEDVAELHGHGGAHNLAALLAAVVARGARIAEPGEFTRRAVVNGKLDLLRAEALLDVIHAGSERALRLAQANLGGRLGEVAAELEARALRVLAEIEGRIDFPDDDLGEEEARVVDGELVRGRGRGARSSPRAFVTGARCSTGSRSRSSARSTPASRRCSTRWSATSARSSRAEPGTTRDYLEVGDVWNGVAVTLIDTAGTRATADAIEARGIELGERRVGAADVVVVVNDGVRAVGRRRALSASGRWSCEQGRSRRPTDATAARWRPRR